MDSMIHFNNSVFEKMCILEDAVLIWRLDDVYENTILPKLMPHKSFLALRLGSCVYSSGTGSNTLLIFVFIIFFHGFMLYYFLESSRN